MKTVKRIFRLSVALMLFAGWGLAASAMHVIWTGNSPIVLPKEQLGCRDTYVNLSKWTVADVQNHPAVVRRLLATNRADTLASLYQSTSHEDLVAQIQETISRGPTTKPVDLFEKAHEAVEQARAVVEH